MSDWISFLGTQGGVSAPWGISHFQAYPPGPGTAPDTWLCDLSHRGLLALEGPDAVKFLQGQVTCDLRDLSSQRWQLGAQCDLKGRVLASFLALQNGEQQILLSLHRSLLADTRTSLGKYMVFSKASLTDISADWVCLGLAGPQAEARAQTALGELPAPGHWKSTEQQLLLRLAPDRFECWLPAAQAQKLWQQWAPGCQLGGSNAWQLLAIRAGVAEVCAETRGLFTPQDLNYPLIQAVSFRKGCYTGQEVVARLHYKAKLKAALYRFALPGSQAELPTPGSNLPDALGQVVMSALDADQQIEVLAVSRHQRALAPTLNQNHVKPQRLALPYTVPVPEQTTPNDLPEQE